MASDQREAVVMFDSAEAASYRTDIKGWVSRDGQYYGNDSGAERTARWAGCTHQRCECGNVFERGRVRCNSCQAKLDTEKYYALPMVEWDGITPVCVFDDDRFFFDEDGLLDFMMECRDDARAQGCEPEVQIVLCEPGKLHLVDADNWCDDLPEDGELPDEVATKLEELNDAIRNAPTFSWWAGKQRINLAPLWEQLDKETVPEAPDAD
jgi:hypothetical protein